MSHEPATARQASPAPPRVLFGVFQTGQRSNGGVESVTQLLEHLPAPAVVLTQQPDGANSRWAAAGHQVEIVDAPCAMPGYERPSLAARLRRLVDMAKINLLTARLVRRRGIDVVHCNDPSAFWHMRFGAALAGRPVVYNVRDTLDAGATPWTRRAKWRLKFALADRIVVLSGEMKRFHVERLALRPGAAAKIDVIPSIVDPGLFDPPDPSARRALRDRLGLAADAFAVGYIATFNPKKGQADFLAKAGPLLKGARGLQVVFIGDFDPAADPYARQCQALIDTLGLGATVRCVGATSAIGDWYRALDAVVLASRYEGLARCMIEGMAAGLPVVSFDVCSARETLEATGAGLVAPQGDYAQLVEHLLALANDPAARRAMGEAGRRRAAGAFVGEAAAKAYGEVYRSLQPGLLSRATETL